MVDKGYYTWMNRYEPGTGWGIAQSIDESRKGGAGVSYPKVVMAPGGKGMVLWNERTDYQLMLRQYLPDTGWSPTEYLQPVGADSGTVPYMAINDKGQALVVWRQRTSSTTWAIHANSYQ